LPVCIAIPGKVRSRRGRRAVVDILGERREIDLGALKPRVGEFVLVQGRVALSRLSKAQASEILGAVADIGGASGA